MKTEDDARAPSQPQAVQLHLVLPYKHQARGHVRVRSYLDRGWRIVDLQRVTDREVLVTLADRLA